MEYVERVRYFLDEEAASESPAHTVFRGVGRRWGRILAVSVASSRNIARETSSFAN